jgi:hypothetical protein
MSTDLKDMIGTDYQVGDRFIKSYQSGRSSNLELCTVTRIEAGRMYANGSKVYIRYPGRCLIVNEQFPIDQMEEE